MSIDLKSLDRLKNIKKCYQLIFSLTELIIVRKTSFCLISVKASSGLRKMFSQCYYNQNGVLENVCLIKLDTHFHYCFDVLTEVWQGFCYQFVC